MRAWPEMVGAGSCWERMQRNCWWSLQAFSRLVVVVRGKGLIRIVGGAYVRTKSMPIWSWSSPSCSCAFCGVP